MYYDRNTQLNAYYELFTHFLGAVMLFSTKCALLTRGYFASANLLTLVWC